MTPKIGEVFIIDLGYQGKVRPVESQSAGRWNSKNRGCKSDLPSRQPQPEIAVINALPADALADIGGNGKGTVGAQINPSRQVG